MFEPWNSSSFAISKDKDRDLWKAQHERTLTRTRLVLSGWVLLTSLLSVLFFARLHGMAKFAHKEFNTWDRRVLITLPICQVAVFGLSNAALCWASDRKSFSFDKALILTMCTVFCGVLLESVANSLQLFFVGVIISATAFLMPDFVKCYIVKMAPKKYAIQLNNAVNVCTLWAVLLASVLCATGTHNTSWHASFPFFISLILEGAFLIPCALWWLYGTQSELSASQYIFASYYSDTFQNASTNGYYQSGAALRSRLSGSGQRTHSDEDTETEEDEYYSPNSSGSIKFFDAKMDETKDPNLKEEILCDETGAKKATDLKKIPLLESTAVTDTRSNLQTDRHYPFLTDDDYRFPLASVRSTFTHSTVSEFLCDMCSFFNVFAIANANDADNDNSTESVAFRSGAEHSTQSLAEEGSKLSRFYLVCFTLSSALTQACILSMTLWLFVFLDDYKMSTRSSSKHLSVLTLSATLAIAVVDYLTIKDSHKWTSVAWTLSNAPLIALLFILPSLLAGFKKQDTSEIWLAMPVFGACVGLNLALCEAFIVDHMIRGRVGRIHAFRVMTLACSLCFIIAVTVCLYPVGENHESIFYTLATVASVCFVIGGLPLTSRTLLWIMGDGGSDNEEYQNI